MTDLTKQICFRLDAELYEVLMRDAEEHGRTIAQSIRFYLRMLSR